LTGKAPYRFESVSLQQRVRCERLKSGASREMSPEGRLRERDRSRCSMENGKFQAQWQKQNLHRPCGLCMPYGHQPMFYVGEVGPAAAVSRDIPNLGPRVSIVDHQGKLIGRFGETPAGIELGKFLAPHGLAVDSRGDVYVGEVSWTAWPQIYPDTPRPDHIRSLQKFEKVG
jgi:hypothetical protein